MPSGEGRRPRHLLVLIATLAACLVLPAVASGAIVVPNTKQDEYNAGPSTCSLREAIKTLNDASAFGGCAPSGSFGTDFIVLPAGTYKLTIGPSSPNDIESGDLNVRAPSLTIRPLSGAVTIDGNGTDRVFVAGAVGGLLTLDGLTLTGGSVDSPTTTSASTGGAIVVGSGNGLKVTNSTLTGNQSDGNGGAISSAGTTTLRNVTISGNTATEQGGGAIGVIDGTLTLDSSTVTDNHGQTLDLASPSVTGGIHREGGSVSAHDSIIAGNTDGSTSLDAPDCEGAITSSDGNVIGDGTGCTLTPMSHDAVGDSTTPIDPLLGPLADNGGTTFTHALLAGSPAIDRGVATCAAKDQRGYPRTTGSSCDSGAYERVLCNGALLNGPGPYPGCKAPAPPPTTNGTTTTPIAAPLPVSLVDPCPPLRKKLRKAKRKLRAARKADEPTAKLQHKVHTLKKKLNRLGC